MRKFFWLFLLEIVLVVTSNSYGLKIVSLAPYLTEALLTLDSKDQLVGITSVGKNLLNLKGIEVVGDTLNVSVEKISALQPDLILATPMNRPGVINKLRSLGFTVRVFGMGENFQDCCQIFLQLGALVGKHQKAVSIIKKVTQDLKNLKARIRNLSPPRVLMVIDYKPLITAGRNCYLDEMISYAGGINVAGKWGKEFFRVSMEKIIESDPEFIISIAKNETIQYWERFSTITAVKHHRVYILNPDIFSRPHPVNFLKAVKLLIAVLHPEIKNEN